MKVVPLERSSMKPWTESKGPIGLGALQKKGTVSALRSSQVKEIKFYIISCSSDSILTNLISS